MFESRVRQNVEIFMPYGINQFRRRNSFSWIRWVRPCSNQLLRGKQLSIVRKHVINTWSSWTNDRWNDDRTWNDSSNIKKGGFVKSHRSILIPVHSVNSTRAFSSFYFEYCAKDLQKGKCWITLNSSRSIHGSREIHFLYREQITATTLIFQFIHQSLQFTSSEASLFPT